MGCVSSQQIRAKQKQAHARLVRTQAWQACGLRGNAARHARVIDTGVGILKGLVDHESTTPVGALAGCVSIDEQPCKALHVFIGATNPVLQAQEIGANILGGAGNKTQNLGQSTQHAHLRCASACLHASARGALFCGFLLSTAKPLEQCQWPGCRLGHIEAPHVGELDHFRGRHDADQCIEFFTPLFE